MTIKKELYKLHKNLKKKKSEIDQRVILATGQRDGFMFLTWPDLALLINSMKLKSPHIECRKLCLSTPNALLIFENMSGEYALNL